MCKAAGADVPSENAANIETHEFGGPHPAGLSGTHIHFIEPVGANKTVWTINYQDVIAIGRLFVTGRLNTERVVALGGPQVNKPRLLRTVLGAKVSQITAGELVDADNRVISGSVLNGAIAQGAHDYLGRYHNQISVIEGRSKELFGWVAPPAGQILDYAYDPRSFPEKQTLQVHDSRQRRRPRHGSHRHLRARDAAGHPAYLAFARFNRRRYRQRAGFGFAEWTKKTSLCAASSARVNTNTARCCARCWKPLRRKADYGLETFS